MPGVLADQTHRSVSKSRLARYWEPVTFESLDAEPHAVRTEGRPKGCADFVEGSCRPNLRGPHELNRRFWVEMPYDKVDTQDDTREG
jgi:hypothetical protein